ncbi:homoserine kinase [Commensalibacter papalotli (ex Botero et al. 2024)]|uniref:Homoserine kinase n=1 Tax=Commensalibacter papalotli (ex Botero et al. 2024) TaxID=2972766 RepID=A0ABM9HMG8_9PROT|nr:homoserine kinase [Commensalibacter papalotli (ex Botero et al. 2024)]CAI3936931.1 MazF antagonist (SrkA) (PDB:1ZYL) [Commensalibacter papalotli (ex Botero et al. 2024)]CAI3938721.1 MazF antagonist (SrkA) (PDB:1ZYL) [Commensalibacter papalotli (ex Botero et al. 2024)]
MAVYTQVSEQEVSQCLQNYEIGDLVTLKGIAQGVENSNFLLETTTGKYILTLYEKRIKEDELPWYLEYMKHLVQCGVSCPLPVVDKRGVALTILARRPAAIVTFLEGKEAPQITEKHCFLLGQAIAHLHQAGAGFTQFRKNNVGPDSWQELLNKSIGYDQEELVQEIQPVLQEILSQWPTDKDNLPIGQIHADIFPDNVFFTAPDQLSGFIDFYFACTDFLAYDLAIAINAWCFKDNGECLTDLSAAVIKGYETIRPLTSDEKRLFPILNMGAAMRFLLTRLHDWIHTPAEALVTPKDPKPYLYRLRYHQTLIALSDGT